MLEVKFSRHAIEKLGDTTSNKLGITQESIRIVLKNPEIIDNNDYPALMAVGRLDEELSLCVVYKFIENGIKVITFFPAKRGRYESKIL